MIASLALVAMTISSPALQFDPTTAYTKEAVQGFTVYVNHKLLDEQPDLAAKVLELLAAKLLEINRTVPAKALERLHRVAIWVELDDPKFPGGCYHSSREWLTENGFNPDKAKSVELGNAANFLTWSLDQPSMVLHELAHAYHDQVLGYDNADLKAAYQHALDAGLYKSVLHCRGGKQRAYALNNDQEFFAEQTEAYFGVNDFYPFVRAELQDYDPAMFEVLRKVWGGP